MIDQGVAQRWLFCLSLGCVLVSLCDTIEARGQDVDPGPGEHGEATAAHSRAPRGGERGGFDSPSAGAGMASGPAGAGDVNPAPGHNFIALDQVLELSRVCKLEAEHRPDDCASIYWIGRKVAGARWMPFLLDYSKLHQRRNARARRIASAPWGDLVAAAHAENRRWRRTRGLALRLVAGLVDDPCPEATGWNCPGCRVQGEQCPATCGAQQDTANVLYRACLPGELPGS